MENTTRLRPSSCGRLWRAMARWWKAVGEYPSDSRSWADSKSLADSGESCWIIRMPADSSMETLFCRTESEWCNAGFSRAYIMNRMFQSFRGPGRCLSKRLVQSGACTWLLAANQERERDDTKQKMCAVLALWWWRWEDVASRPTKRDSLYGLHEKANTHQQSVFDYDKKNVLTVTKEKIWQWQKFFWEGQKKF